MNNIFAPKYDSGRKFAGTFGLLKDPPPSCGFCTDAADIYYLRGYSCTKCFEKHIKARESYLNTLTLKEKIAFYKWQGWFIPMKWEELAAEQIDDSNRHTLLLLHERILELESLENHTSLRTEP